MDLNLKSLSSEENKMLMYNIFYFLMPVSKFLLNSKIIIEESDSGDSYITADILKDKYSGEYQFNNFRIVMNINKCNAMYDYIKFKESINLEKRKQGIFLISLVLCHEILHFMMGDLFITKRQNTFLNKESNIFDNTKKLLHNIATDCIVNEILLDIANRIYKEKKYIKLIQYFKYNSIEFNNIEIFIRTHCQTQANIEIERAREYVYKLQDSWKLFIMLHKICNNTYISDISNLTQKLISTLVYQTIGDIKNNQGDFLTNIIGNSLIRQVINRNFKRTCGQGSSLFERSTKETEKSKTYHAFTEIYKIINRFNLLPDNNIIENTDNVITLGYSPYPKAGFYYKNNKYKEFEYYFPSVFPRKPNKVILYIDVSGSMTDEDIADIRTGNRRINIMYPNLDVEIFLWSTEVYEADKNISKIYSTGGSVFKCVKEHIKKNCYPILSNILILSDGYWENFDIKLPGIENFKYFFVINCEGSLKYLLKFFKINNIDVKKRVYVTG